MTTYWVDDVRLVLQQMLVGFSCTMVQVHLLLVRTSLQLDQEYPNGTWTPHQWWGYKASWPQYSSCQHDTLTCTIEPLGPCGPWDLRSLQYCNKYKQTTSVKKIRSKPICSIFNSRGKNLDEQKLIKMMSPPSLSLIQLNLFRDQIITTQEEA